jgi:hypothetical protein
MSQTTFERPLPDSLAAALVLSQVEFMDQAWADYLSHKKRRAPHDYSLFEQCTQRLAADIRYETQALFSQTFWARVFEYEDERDLLNCAPQVIYARGFWKPILYEACARGFYQDWREALLCLHYYDRYQKRGELLDELVCALYAPRQVFDCDLETLRAEWSRRSLLPADYTADQPQMSMF